jgi:hypothetical protein
MIVEGCSQGIKNKESYLEGVGLYKRIISSGDTLM